MYKLLKFELPDGSILEQKMEFHQLTTDRFQFTPNSNEDGFAFFFFDHQQQHSRLDLSLLEDSLLIFFDKHQDKVGITYCHKSGTGPFEVHNKQRLFIVGNRTKVQVFTKVVRVILEP